MRRRRFLLAAAAVSASCRRAPDSWRFFTAAEALTVAAICERIIPADQDPGAAWAGVVTFIDRQLATRQRGLRKTYREGLARLGSGFAELPPARQIQILQSIEKDRFFQLLLAHTMQGFYGDPRHGGNRDGISYRMLGLTYPPIRGRVPWTTSTPLS